MCAGGQDIPVTLRVAGGVEGGKWKSEDDVRATPQPEEEVETTETTETTEVPEPVGPSTPLYQPVIDRINKLSEKLPDEVADETVQEMQPMMHHGWGMNDRNHHHTMQMLDNIMRNTSRRPRPPRPGGPGKWGGGGKQPWRGHDPRRGPRRPPQTLGGGVQQIINQPGLAGLFAGPQRESDNASYGPVGTTQVMPQQGIPVPQMGTQMPMPMQPAVMEEQQMEILGQPKQFANGGIVNALMATPVGQAALRQYATGGEVGEDVEAEQVLEHTPTGATIEDILAGRATFFGPAKYRHAEVISDISDTLGVAPIKKKKREAPWQPDDAVEEELDLDSVTGVTKGLLSEMDYDPNDPSKPGKGVFGGTIGGGFGSREMPGWMKALAPGMGLYTIGKTLLGGDKEPEKQPYNFGVSDKDISKYQTELLARGITPGHITQEATRPSMSPLESNKSLGITPGHITQIESRDPIKSVQKSTANLINYGTKPTPGKPGPVGTPQVDKLLNRTAGPATTKSISKQDKDIWSQQFGTPSQPPEVGSQTLHGGTPTTPIDSFDSTLWGPPIDIQTPYGVKDFHERSLQSVPLSAQMKSAIDEMVMGKDKNLLEKYTADRKKFQAALGMDMAYNLASTLQGLEDIKAEVDSFSDYGHQTGGYDAGSDFSDGTTAAEQESQMSE